MSESYRRWMTDDLILSRLSSQAAAYKDTVRHQTVMSVFNMLLSAAYFGLIIVGLQQADSADRWVMICVGIGGSLITGFYSLVSAKRLIESRPLYATAKEMKEFFEAANAYERNLYASVLNSVYEQSLSDERCEGL